MLPIESKKLLFDLLPSSYNNIDIQKTIGKFEGELQYPSINLSFPSDGTKYFSPPGNFEYINNDTMYGQEIQTSICRIVVYATNTKFRTTQDIIFVSGQTEYTLNNTPIRILHGDPDYDISSTYDSIIWQSNMPNDGENFTVDYTYILNGYWFASEIIEYIRKDIFANYYKELSKYHVDILDVTNIDNISMMYVNENITALTFDIKVIYPFTWSRPLTDDDGVLLDSVNTTISKS